MLELWTDREMLKLSTCSPQPSGGGGSCPNSTQTQMQMHPASSSSALALSESSDSALGRSLLSAHDSPPAAVTPSSNHPGPDAEADGATTAATQLALGNADQLKLHVDFGPDSLPPGWVLCNGTSPSTMQCLELRCFCLFNG